MTEGSLEQYATRLKAEWLAGMSPAYRALHEREIEMIVEAAKIRVPRVGVFEQ